MQVRIKGRCRGEGKTYVWIQAHVSEGSRLFASSVNVEGDSLPCKLLPLGIMPREGWHECVLVVFTMNRRQFVTFSELDAAGNTVSSVKRTIIPLHSTWASRANGVLRKELCAKIRNFDWKGLARQSILTLDRCVPKKNSWLFRGSLFVSCENANDAFISVFDASGTEIPVTVHFLSSASASMSDGHGSPLKEVRFSVELPTSQPIRGNYCFLAGNKKTPESACFEVLEPHVGEGLKEQYWNAFCDAWHDPAYGPWMRRHRITAKRAALQCETRFEYEPLFSIVVPLYKTPLSFFEEMAESVIAQTYSSWELVLVNASPEDEGLASLSRSYAELDERIKLITLEGNRGITENTNVGIKESKGDFLCFFDHDDVLEPDILFEYVRALNQYDDIDLLYCDEDKLFPDGRYATPMFKPDFSIDLLRDNNYVCHMLTVRKDLHSRLEPAGEDLDGAQDHNLVLQVAEQGRRIHHVSRVLYHWRISENSTAGNASSKPYATQAGIRAVENHLNRLGIQAKVECAHGRDFRYKIDYPLVGEPPVSLVMPTRGGLALLEALESIFELSTYAQVEIVLSVSEECERIVKREIAGMASRCKISVVSYAGAFNYSSSINAGVACASGEYLVIMHDDVRISSPEWIETLLRHCMRDDVGVVGPMICDFDGVIQQAGLFFVDGEVIPSSPGLYKEFPGYAYRPLSTQNLSAVSGVCMMTRRDTFERMQGFDPIFVRKYGEIDYCFRVRQSGSLVVYTPEVSIDHRASRGRGRETDLNAMPEYYREKASFLDRWACVLAEGDPYFNCNFSHVPGEACTFKLNSEKSVEL